jgi:hypothetical protein
MTTLVANVPPTKVWLPVVGYEGLYEVSNDGQVKSIDRIVKGRFGSIKRKEHLLAQHVNKNKKLQVRISKNGKKKNFEVAVLVAEAFLGPRPKGLCVLHGPLGGLNNCVNNLSYGTYSQNAGPDRSRDNTLPKGETHPRVKRTLTQIRDIKIAYLNGETQVAIARRFNTSQGYISNIIKNRIWKCDDDTSC